MDGIAQPHIHARALCTPLGQLLALGGQEYSEP
jgi:hypothetical protein